MSATLFVPGSPGGEAEWHRALEAQGFAVTGGELSGGELPFRDPPPAVLPQLDLASLGR